VFRYHRERSGVAAGHPHALRHLFGTALAEAGVDLPVIQALMGHDHVDSAAEKRNAALHRSTTVTCRPCVSPTDKRPVDLGPR
jgi:integrase